MNPPVFIVGCPRSGTTLLYHMLLSSGKFAVYMAETDVYHRIAPVFGNNFRSLTARRKLMDVWLHSDYFRRSGLPVEPLRSKVLSECQNPGDFLRTVMEGVAQQQRVDRWADNTPLHALYIPEIKTDIPNAKFVHVIRDGRDVATSLNRLGWVDLLPWDLPQRLAVSALYWEWVVRKCRRDGHFLRGADYIEVHYEDLVKHPQETLIRLSAFLSEDLTYGYISSHALGVLVKPNSSFPHRNHTFTPLDRWTALPPGDGSRLTALLAPLLRELNYPASECCAAHSVSRRLRFFYPKYFWLSQQVRQSELSHFFVRGMLQKGALDKEDSRWEVIQDSSRPAPESVALESEAARLQGIQ